MAPSVAAVLVGVGVEHAAPALAELRRVIDRALPGARSTTAVVDNALAGDVEQVIDPSATRISGDNRQREFTGWDRGLAWLAATGALARAQVLVLANDTLHRSYGARWLEDFTQARVEAALAAGALLGWIDAYPRPVELFGLRLERWVRTSLLFARAETLARLRPLALPAADSELFSGDPSDPFRVPSPLSDRYRDYLRAWITGDGSRTPEFPFTWHSAAPLTAGNLALMQGKIRSILCEHHLSARATAAGIPLHDLRR